MKLKAVIDRLTPASADFEDLLLRLQREGYEIKQGKYVSCRASDQERFTRLKTLGVDYTEGSHHRQDCRTVQTVEAAEAA